MRWLIVIFIVASCVPALAQSAQDYYTQGQNLLTKEDLDGARLAFSYAVALSPDNPVGLVARTNVELRMNLLHEAMDDCNRAIELQPQIAEYLFLRSRIYLAAGDLREAQSNLDRGLDIEVRSTRSYAHAAIDVEFAEGQFDDVMALINKFDAGNPQAYHWSKGVVDELEGKDADAITDFEERSKLNNPADAVYWCLWVLLSKQGQAVAANEQLSRRLASGNADYPKDWRTLISRFLLGRASEADVFAKTRSSNIYLSHARCCQFFYFAGIKHLLDGDKKAARDDFRQSVATNRLDLIEYLFSRAELKAAGAGG